MKLSLFTLSLFFLMFRSSLHGEVWTAPADISTSGVNSSFPDVALNDSGQIVAVWIGDSKCRVSTATFGGNWSAPAILQSSSNTASSPSSLINDKGEALASWTEAVSSNQKSIFVATLLTGANWSDPLPLALGKSVVGASFSICSMGHINAAIETSSSSGIQVYKASFGGNWTSPLKVGDPTCSQVKLGYRESPHIGLIGIIWRTSSEPPPKQLIFAELLSQVESLSFSSTISGTQLSASGQDAETPQLALNSNRQAVAIWSRSNGTNKIIQTCEKPSGGKWSTPVSLSASSQNASLPLLALNDAGQAVAVWKRSNGTNTIIQASTLNFGATWSTPIDLSQTGQNADNPKVAINAKGECIALWQRPDGTSTRIQAAITGISPLPPSNLRLTSKLITCPQGNYYHIYLLWNAPSTSSIASYKIYRNGVLAATQRSDRLIFQDFLKKTEGVPVTYEVSALSNGGGESVKVPVSLP